MASAARASSTAFAPVEPEDADGGLPVECVAEIQRARMLMAMVEVAAERGVGDVTVAHVVSRSGVSRRTFYEFFANREECYLAAFDESVARARGAIADGCEAKGRWTEKLRAALTSLLQLFDEEPHTGRLLVVDSLGAGPNALERRRVVQAEIVAAIDAQGRSTEADPSLSRLIAEGAVGAALSIVHARMLDGGDRALVDLVNPVMSVIVLPYLGRAAARREFERALPARGDGAEHAVAVEDPLRGLGMRLTYRTVRVLFAVARTPRASNREVGQVAGIVDQGQISKLLNRLEGLGLVCNERVAGVRGAPNAWALTHKGVAAKHAMSANMTPQGAL
jgi:AcrR family transcriptional regulator